ncbi:hypothetical protein BABINDRAFT_20608, partial [Babjeviella inositovora NRRL Y-12698]
MGAAYVIFGKTVQPHVLALATLAPVFFYAAVPNPFAGKTALGEPPINASSPEEESFIK